MSVATGIALGLIAVGLDVLYRAIRGEGMVRAVVQQPARRRRRRLESARHETPHAETDPFRAPPQPEPLHRVRPPTEPPEAPIVPGDPDDKPTILR